MGRYVEAAQVIRYMGENPEDPVLRADVEFHIAVAEDLVDQYCRCQMDLREGEEIYLSGNDSAILVPREYILVIDTVEVVDEDDEVLDTLDCVIMPDNPRFGSGRWIERRDGLTFPEGRKNIKITGDLGFATVPTQLAYCVHLVIRSLFQRRQINDFIAVESGNGRLIQLKEEKDLDNYIPAMARKLLNQFKNSAGLA